MALYSGQAAQSLNPVKSDTRVVIQYQNIRKVDTLALEWDTIRLKILAFEWKGVNPDTVGRSCEINLPVHISTLQYWRGN